MGIRGLLSFILEHRDQCVEYQDLINVARERNGIEILVDYYSFQQYLMERFWQGLNNQFRNNFLKICGGEYKTLDAYVKKIVMDLKSLDIHLVMYVDGAKGSSKSATEQKFETWKSRQHGDIERMRMLLDVCCDRRQIEDLPERTLMRPVCLEIQMFDTLKACQCEIIQCTYGEADFVIAKDLQVRPKAYAVLSNDTDFALMRDCMFIPTELFDISYDLALAESSVPEKPIRLKVGIVSSKTVGQTLGFGSDHAQLIELSIVAGNDFTGEFARSLQHKIGICNRPKIQDFANWLQKHRNVENCPAILSLMQSNRQYANAVHRSRRFYTLNFHEEMPDHDEQTDYICEHIQSGDFPPSIMGMHRCFYWHRMLLENCNNGHPTVEIALSQLRAFLYRMILPRQKHFIMEHGRTPVTEFGSAKVYEVTGPAIPLVQNVNQEKIFQSLRLFHRIFTSLEPPDFNVNFFDRYGRKNGFLCYILRYFLSLNLSNNLEITYDEFMAVLAVAFSRSSHENHHYQCLNIRPDVRCVTIANWFQDVYRHAYDFFAKVLFLSHEFPKAREVFSGSVFVAFYSVTCTRHHGGLPDEKVRRILKDYRHVVKEQQHVIRYIVQGIFEFYDRF